MKTHCLLFLFVGLLFVLCAQVPPASARRPPQWPSGICPRPQGIGDCRRRCRSDRTCSWGEKCCFNGCGYQCTKVSGGRPPTNPGKCPRPQRPVVCGRRCRSDRDCARGQKCCNSSCGRQCMRAVRG